MTGTVRNPCTVPPGVQLAMLPFGRSGVHHVLSLAPVRVLQVSGMKIRFLTLIRELRKAGDDVLVVTPDANPPATYHGAKVCAVLNCAVLCLPPTCRFALTCRNPLLGIFFGRLGRQQPPFV